MGGHDRSAVARRPDTGRKCPRAITEAIKTVFVAERVLRRRKFRLCFRGLCCVFNQCGQRGERCFCEDKKTFVVTMCKIGHIWIRLHLLIRQVKTTSLLRRHQKCRFRSLSSIKATGRVATRHWSIRLGIRPRL